MSVWAVVGLAYEADPIACWVAVVASAIVTFAALFRRGAVDAPFAIGVFSAFATLGTLLKVVLWMATVLAGRPISPPSSAAPPSGTDLVLVAGGLCAILVVSLQSLFNGLHGEGDLSFAQRGYALAQALFRSPGSAVHETDEAKRVRELEIER